MIILLSDLEKIKKKMLLYIKFFGLGIISCFTLVIVLSAFYQGLVQVYYPWPATPIHQELNIIEILWMITLLLQLFFINTTIWYFISYKLSSKSIKNIKIAEKNEGSNQICYNCGIESSIENIKTNKSKEIRSTQIFGVKGHFCKGCYKKY